MNNRLKWKRAALLLAAGLGLAASPTARADIVRLAVEWSQNRASFVYSGPDVEGELPCYVLGDLPEGFVQTGWQRLGPAMATADYENAAGDCLYLDYTICSRVAAPSSTWMRERSSRPW